MKRVLTSLTISLTILCTVPLLSSLALSQETDFDFGGIDPGDSAGTSAEQQPGLPPFGVTVDTHAKGQKFPGVLVVEFINMALDANRADRARIVLRLQKKHVPDSLHTFFGQIAPLSPNDTGSLDITAPSTLQGFLQDTLFPKVLEFYFPGQSGLTVKVKKFQNVAQRGAPMLNTNDPCIFNEEVLGATCSYPDTDASIGETGTKGSGASLYLVADITLAVKAGKKKASEEDEEDEK